MTARTQSGCPRSSPRASGPPTRGRARLTVAVLGLALSLPCAAVGLDDARVAAFVEEVAGKHNLDLESVQQVVGAARMENRVLEAYKRPAESRPWHSYRKIFLTETRIADGVAFWDEHAELLAQVEARFGVPARIVVAIVGVETSYGQRKGDIRVIDALVTLAFHYPKRERFFRRELEAFLLLAREGHVEPLLVQGSYAGAMGIPQFISSSYRAYAVDMDGDGRRDLLNDVADALGSVGNYLARHAWQAGAAVTAPARLAQPAARAIAARGHKPHTTLGALRAAGVAAFEGVDDDTPAALLELDGEAGPEFWVTLDNFYAITRYNHSPLYAMAVHQLAGEIEAARASRRKAD